jgi:hypothetical protein
LKEKPRAYQVISWSEDYSLENFNSRSPLGSRETTMRKSAEKPTRAVTATTTPNTAE